MLHLAYWSSQMWLENHPSYDTPRPMITSHCPNQLTCINICNSLSNLHNSDCYYLWFADENARGRRQGKMSAVPEVLIRSQIRGRFMSHAKKLKCIPYSASSCRFFKTKTCILEVCSGSCVNSWVELERTGKRGGNPRGRGQWGDSYYRSSQVRRGREPLRRRRLERVVWLRAMSVGLVIHWYGI